MIKLVMLLSLIVLNFSFAQVNIIPLPDLPKNFCALKELDEGEKGIIKRVAIIYKTKNKFGEQTLASGLVAYQHDVVETPTPIFFMHATPRTKIDAPSHGSFESKFFICNALSRQTVVIAPDYVGLGFGLDDHPYMVKDITISASMDFFRVAKSWLEKQNQLVKSEMILAGYSQGGHAALAIHEHIERIEKDIKVKHTFSMSGPTNLSGNMLQNILEEEPNKDTSFFTAVSLSSFQRHYGHVYTSYPFRAEFDQIEELARNIDRKGLNKYTPNDPRDLLTPVYFDDISHNLNHPFRKRLEENNINAWKAQSPITLTYSAVDTTIPAKDTKDFYQKMKALNNDVEIVRVSEYLPHTINFLKSVKYFSKRIRSQGL